MTTTPTDLANVPHPASDKAGGRPARALLHLDYR